MADTVDTEAKKKLSEVVKLARVTKRPLLASCWEFPLLLSCIGKGAGTSRYEKFGSDCDKSRLYDGRATGHLEGKPVQEPLDTNELLKKIQCMPLSDLAVIVRAGMERLAAAAVASGKYG